MRTTKKIELSLLLLSLLITSCNKSHRLENGIISIDLREVPSAIEIVLQDIAEVEYVVISNDSDFIPCTRMANTTDKYMLFKGGEDMDELMLFDRKGNPISKFNHNGQGPHEYLSILCQTLDEKEKEIFVYDYWNEKMMVYDFEGNFIRSFKCTDVGEMHTYDDTTFICHHYAVKKVKPDYMPYFTLISKKDGNILRRIDLPYSINTQQKLSVITEDSAGEELILSTIHWSLVSMLDGGFAFNELSSDTIYRFSPDEEMTPIMVREPSITDDNTLFLEYGVNTKDYTFLTKTKADKNNPKNMFSSEEWIYSKQEDKVYKVEVINEDYPDYHIELNQHILYEDLPQGYAMIRYRTHHLCEAYQNDKLHGKLKEIASKLNEEDNDVYMMIKFK